MKYLQLIFLLFFTTSIFLSCAKEEDRNSSIPISRVEINIETTLNHGFNNPYYFQKYYSNQNGVLYAGYAGVIVISNHEASGVYAYDLCCPHEAPQKKELQMEGSFKMKCPACNSVYNLMDSGRPVSGPSTEKMKNYSVYRDGTFYRIRN